MSRNQARAWLNLTIWVSAGSAFGIAFFAAGGPWGYAPAPSGFGVATLSVPLAIAATVAASWFTGRLPTDERDERVESRAARTTFLTVAFGVFALSMILYDVYRAEGVVPVGWLRLMEYGVLIATGLVHPTATLVVDARLGGHGRG